MLKIAKKLKKLKKDEMIMRTFKLTALELKELEAKANKYTDGNVSLWLRYAGKNHVPAAKDLD